MKATRLFLFTLMFAIAAIAVHATDRPNIVIFFADDISARELPVYGSSVWSDPYRENTSDPEYRAKTPVMAKLAAEGCWISTAWAATVCNPSRAMMLSGRYAYITKWWNNKDKGHGPDENGDVSGTWPVYMSSPLLLGHAAQKMGYGTFWAGKTQMAGSYERHGFDEGCFTPGGLSEKDNPHTDFKHEYKMIDGKRRLINVDTGDPCETYIQHGWYWYPHVKLLNHPSAPDEYAWWPNTPEAKKEFGLTTYGPDVELEFVFDFMERTHEEGKPFFIYHTTHLGHDAFNWFDPDDESSWPGTPKIEWDGKKYTRQEPKVTGDNGVYDTHNSITGSGIHNHVNYIDYQVWQYLQKFRELGVEDNTVFIFTADNGTGGYGKNKGIQQRGCHVPLIIYSPGMTKQGEQDILVSLADILPTMADLIGFEFPEDYKLDGKSLVPYLFGDEKVHREWLYTFRGPEQLVRGDRLLKDGNDDWWDITNDPEDLTSYKEVSDWQDVPESLRNEKQVLIEVLPEYDLYYDAYNAPGITYEPGKRPWYGRKSKEQKEY